MQYYSNPGFVYPYPNTYASQQNSTAVPTQPQSQNTFVWVQGEDAAMKFPVAPGNTVVLIDSDKPVMYMKTTDLSGRPQPMEIRYLVNKEDYEKIQNGGNFSSNSDEYVTKAVFEKYIEEAANKFALKRRDK